MAAQHLASPLVKLNSFVSALFCNCVGSYTTWLHNQVDIKPHMCIVLGHPIHAMTRCKINECLAACMIGCTLGSGHTDDSAKPFWGIDNT